MTLLEQLRPGFFELEEIKNIPDDWGCFDEMVLKLPEFCAEKCTNPKPEQAEFGMFFGEWQDLLDAVAEVEKGWLDFYKPKDEVFVATVNGEIASFCMIEDMGTHTYEGITVKVGGPGCVGTVPKYRKKGIGLEMVRRVTEILKKRGYDISYIHYTGVAKWYAKLGYVTINRWNKHGFVEMD